MQDAALLRRYAESGSEDAFSSLVRGCLPLVYGAALRRVGGNVHLAQDVTQLVFTAVAREAPRLTRHPDLTGWLFTTTRYLAAKVLRTELRRHAREHAAWPTLASDDEPPSETPARLHAMLDDVLMELKQLDRDMLLLRFYRGLRLADIGARFNSSENAVQKRIERALERLKGQLARRGITSTAAAVAAVLEAHGSVAVPAGLAAATTTAGLAGGGSAGPLAASLGGLWTSKLPLFASLAIAIGTSAGLIWMQRENVRLRTELELVETSAVVATPAAQPAGEQTVSTTPIRPPSRVVASATSQTAPPPPLPIAVSPSRASAAAVPAVDGDLVPLEIEYPKPLVTGPPRPIRVRNLEAPGTLTKDLLVPRGTALLSRGHPVTSSDRLPVLGALEFVTDGDKRGIDGSYVELGPGLQWVQIDLGAVADIHAIAVWHYHSAARVYHDVVVQVSADKDFTRDVLTLFNNDNDNSAGFGRGSDLGYLETNRGRVIAGRSARARYVRLYSNGNTSNELNHYCEVEVYGQRNGPP